jgi:hypothetical protein
VLRRCVGTFAGSRSTVQGVTVLGARSDTEKAPGAKLSALMVDSDGRIAYAGSTDGLHVRWSAGLGLTMVCGMLIAWVTGARRLTGRRARSGAVLLCFAGPLLLFLGMLAATF